MLPDGREINYMYDANGNLTSITPPSRPNHSFTYTPVNLEESYIPPSPQPPVPNPSTYYSYNLDKQLTLITRPDGQTVSLGYDTGGRLSSLSTSTLTLTSTYTYSSTTGNLSTITAPSGTLSYTYDGSLLKGTAWTGTISGSVGFTYNSDFRITSETVNGGNSVGYVYDNDGLLTGAGSLTISRNTQNGLITGTTLGSTTTSQSYNGFGEISNYNAKVSGASVVDVQYTRDALGRITQKVETVAGTNTDTYTYSYDLAGRLTGVTKDGVTTAQYSYDSNSNRTSYTNLNGTINGTYDAQDRLTQYGNATYTYTANGELLTKTDTDTNTVTTYQYDVLGNLISATLPDGTLVEYVIDGNNRRIGKKVNGVLTQAFLYQDQLKPVAELDGAGNVVSRFIYGTKANVPDYMVKGGITYRIISDHLGSPRLVIDTSTGQIAQQMDYDEFGNITQDINSGFQPFGFAGGLYDQHTKLTRFGARDYDAETGRWTAKDPIRFKGRDTNLFEYNFNDPVNFIDSWGLTTWPAVGTVTSLFGTRTDPFTGTQSFHNGIDIANPVGGAVVASDSGVVISTTPSPNGANQIVIRHNDGTISGYAHVNPSVSVGQPVNEGQTIGTTDLSGRSTGGHLHYTFRPSGGQPYVDPLSHLPPQNNYPTQQEKSCP